MRISKYKHLIVLTGVVCATNLANSEDRFPMAYREQLAARVWMAGHPSDYDEGDETSELPVRECEKDVIPRYENLMITIGCSTNQLIDGLIYLATNFVNNSDCSDLEERTFISNVALEELSEINHPLARNFIAQACTNNSNVKLAGVLPGVFRYTNLEPEVFDYLRTVCVQTNRYEDCSVGIVLGLRNVCRDLSSEVRPVATTNLCKYIYFVMHHTSYGVFSHDGELMELLPSYSNSMQRIRILQHINNTNTNEHRRSVARLELEPLVRIPTNELNDVYWLEGE